MKWAVRGLETSVIWAEWPGESKPALPFRAGRPAGIIHFSTQTFVRNSFRLEVATRVNLVLLYDTHHGCMAISYVRTYVASHHVRH